MIALMFPCYVKHNDTPIKHLVHIVTPIKVTGLHIAGKRCLSQDITQLRFKATEKSLDAFIKNILAKHFKQQCPVECEHTLLKVVHCKIQKIEPFR